MRPSIAMFMAAFITVVQDQPPPQPHTEDPKQCTRYCHPEGLDSPPRGTPEGIPGYVCQGDKCAKAMDEKEPHACEESIKCTSHCAKVCCTCLEACL